MAKLNRQNLSDLKCAGQHKHFGVAFSNGVFVKRMRIILIVGLLEMAKRPKYFENFISFRFD